MNVPFVVGVDYFSVLYFLAMIGNCVHSAMIKFFWAQGPSLKITQRQDRNYSSRTGQKLILLPKNFLVRKFLLGSWTTDQIRNL